MSIISKCTHSALFLALVSGALTGCSMLPSGKDSQLAEEKTAPAKPVETAYVYVPESGGIPLPLMSPRRAGTSMAEAAPATPKSAPVAEAPQKVAEAKKPVPAAKPAIPFTPAPSFNVMAAPYEKFEQALTAAEASKLNTPTEVRKVLKDLRYTQPSIMAEAWYATRASIAMQNEEFVSAVRQQVSEWGKTKVLAALDNSAYIMQLPGAGDAINDITLAESEQNGRLKKLRIRFLDVASQFQRQKKWGMITPLSGDRTQFAEAADTPDTEGFWTGIARELSPISTAQAYSQATMTRILALAARRIIDAPVSLSALSQDETATCLNWARLNLNQCIAAAHFPSEEAWCTGTHGIGDVGACWAKILPVSLIK